MAEKTEITFGYLREFRDEKVTKILKGLKEQKAELEKYIDSGESPKFDTLSINGIRAGNPELFEAAGEIALTINTSVIHMREEIEYLIEQFEGLDDRLEEAHIRFADAEADSVITAEQLKVLIDPGSAGSGRA
ncbi:hypothetical protein ACFO4E_27075 [Nocardiopsis mangrovi]|uniref:Uncharacterized protein n=1 Tax=Nocardiopsis mangrovi TaxID=1179818 RepID=A0ABV9E5F3_9ACTN